MQNEPINNERFDEYEPNKYHCIAIDDNFIEPILIDLQKILTLQSINSLIKFMQSLQKTL